MSANFYLSSHANQHLHPRAALVTARLEDYRLANEQELGWIEIWSASAMQKICKRLGLRQQVLATAIVFFRRFYLRNSYCETDPALVAAACCYVAAKAEETPVHVKSAVGEAKVVFNDMGLHGFTSENHRLAEMEFYLLEELDFHLVVFHPYRALVQLCGRDGGATAGGEEGKASRKGMLEMDDTALQMAWFIINDTFRSSLCLVHPPHLIAVAAVYLAFALHPPASAAAQILPPPDASSSSAAAKAGGSVSSRTRRQSTDSTAPSSASAVGAASTGGAATGTGPGGHTDPVTFLASLEVDTSLVLEIVQEIVSLYELWAQLEAGASASSSSLSSSPAAAALGVGSRAGTPSGGTNGRAQGPDERVVGILRRMQEQRMRDLRDERTKMAQAAGSAGAARRAG
ncbi:cyclin-like protein [Rhodotorula diobovata]|uniref:Cyclin-like protein n=1 Tax=Rhodotorula diobovata TaxID=5288 RepID=A0A5C5FLJ4_9BASI|nr:cyclin-like protein [Rhodotorula diobovata]